MVDIKSMAAVSMTALLIFTAAVALRGDADADEEFDFSNPQIPLEKIMGGGPPKDGIPAILNPDFVSAKEAAEYMKDSDRVMGLEINGEARAYPVKIMNWHELVNDRIGDTAVLVSFCPLCGTGMVFDRMFKGKEYSFGVSGLLYESDLLFYDHNTESLWSQIEGMAVTGKMSGSELKMLPVLNTTWKFWKKNHPGTIVLTSNTGYNRSYDADPYGGYYTSQSLMFPVTYRDYSRHPKEMTMGVKINGEAKVYFYRTLLKEKAPFDDTIGGQKVTVHFDKASKTGFITDEKGNKLSATVGFWFAWYAFNKDTKIYKEDTTLPE